MKKFSLLIVTLFLITGFYSCNKVEDNKTALCNNGIQDGGETEIDCGAACTACPGAPSISCNLGNSSFVSTNPANTYGQTLGPSIRIYGNDGRPLFFMFIPSAVNQPLPVTSVSFSYNWEAYAMEAGDRGEVVLTTLDTLRKIASGTFWFTANRTTGPDSTGALNGVFSNIRYNH